MHLDSNYFSNLGQAKHRNMKLLMITRKVDKNDPQAGFVYNWIKKIGAKTDELKVICLSKGDIIGLPNNVEIFSMGKENGKNRLKEFINFQKGALKFIRQVDGVFCHQNPEYTILITFYAKLFRKKIVSWYAHKMVNWKVKLMAFFADKIATSSELGFQISTPKKIIIGQGIDTNLFRPMKHDQESGRLRIISVGRISPIKDYKTLIKAVAILMDRNIFPDVKIVGEAELEEQKKYYEELKKIVLEKIKNKNIFQGGLSQQELIKFYQKFNLAVNLCPTGAMDKAGLEAMACGLPLLACNKTFAKIFGPYEKQLLFQEKNSEDLANKIIELSQSGQIEEIGRYLREQVVKYHNLDNLLDKILLCF